MTHRKNKRTFQLVDTAFLSHQDQKVVEVSGSCFCCNLDGLISAVDHLRVNAGAQVILAEPVGSCTDLSATVIQPIKDLLANKLMISPLSVMVDPGRLTDTM